MIDTISRQQAINALMVAIDEVGVLDGDDIKVVFDKLPSAQPERLKGKWIPTASEKGRHECSRCHEYAPCYQDGSEHLSTFCVLCGAKMDGGEEG